MKQTEKCGRLAAPRKLLVLRCLAAGADKRTPPASTLTGAPDLRHLCWACGANTRSSVSLLPLDEITFGSSEAEGSHATQPG